MSSLAKNYQIEELPDGTPILVRDDRQPISQAEQEALLAAIRASKYHAREAHYKQLFWEVLPCLEWQFPKKRTDMWASGNCIYMLRASAYPDAVKIGRTGSLTSRTKCYQTNLGEMPSVIAFAQTENCEEAEKAFHAHFSESLKYENEWFDETTVLEFMQFHVWNGGA